MITVINEYTGMSADKPRKEIIASSSDELGDVVAGHGSIGYSIEDATLNIYDEESKEWTAVQAGGGGASNKFIVTLTPTNETGTEGTTDKTGAELYQAYRAGKEIVFSIPFLQSVAYISNVTDIGTAVQPYATISFSPDGTNYVLAHVYTGYAYSGRDVPLSYSVLMFALTPLS